MKRENAGDGFIVTSETATPLVSGNHTYWDAFWKGIVLQFLSKTHPNVSVKYGKDAKGSEDGSFKATFRKDSRAGREMCAKSKSLENPKTRIPESEVDALIADLDRLHREAVKEENTEEAKRFAREYRVPDPREMRGAWRIARGPVKKLLVLWGYHDKGNALSAVLPKTPTSRDWEDAKQRIDIKEALREAGRIGRCRYDWPWIISRILGGLLLLLLLLLLFRNCNGCDGCGPNPTLCPKGCGMVCYGNGKCNDGCDCGCVTNDVPVIGGCNCGKQCSDSEKCATECDCGCNTNEFSVIQSCNCGKGCSDSQRCATDCDCGCVTNGPVRHIEFDMCSVHTNIVKVGGECIAKCSVTMEDGSLCGNHLDENWICDKHTDIGPQEELFEDCGGICGLKHRQGEKCPDGCVCGCNGKTGPIPHNPLPTNVPPVIGPIPTNTPPIHPAEKTCKECGTKLDDGGKCPNVCPKHPDVHLDKDGKCSKCEEPQPKQTPVVTNDFTVRCKSDGENPDGSFSPEFELECKDGSLPRKANIQWRVDGVVQPEETKEKFKPYFQDGSRRIISADISWKPLLGKQITKTTPGLPWSAKVKPAPPPKDFSIVPSNTGRNDDGSYSPIFRLESKEEFPQEASIKWRIDGQDQPSANKRDFQANFPDGSRHVVSAEIGWKDEKGVSRRDNANCEWHPDADVNDVKRYVFYVGAREDEFGTYYIFSLGSDPEDGKAAVSSWSVEKTSPQKRNLEHFVDDGYLCVHSREIAGKAIVRITANIEIAGKESREIIAEMFFGAGAAPVETSSGLTVEEAEKMEAAGRGIVPSVFLVQAGGSRGTAFAVTKRHLVTNNHVIDSVGVGGEVALFRSHTGEQFSGRVVKSAYPNADLALVEVVDGPELTALAIAETVSMRQPVACVGFGVNASQSENPYEPKTSIGVIEGYDPRSGTIFSDMNTFHGNSGSPIANEHGQVLGALFIGIWEKSSDGEIDKDKELSGIVSLEMLEKWLTLWGVRWGI